MQNKIVIKSASELIRLAADPNVAVHPTDALVRDACEILESRVEAAEKAGGREMVAELRFVRGVAGRLAETVQRKSLRNRVLALADGYSDEHILWLLTSRILTAEQHEEIRQVFSA